MDEGRSVADAIAELDAAIARAEEVRAVLVKGVSNSNTLAGEQPEGADDFSEHNLIECSAASERFGLPQDKIRRWCRTSGIGKRCGGRWRVSIPALRRLLAG
jgi:hypothetical protein